MPRDDLPRFTISPAAGSLPRRGDQAAVDQPSAAAANSVRPIPAHVLDSILERRLPGIRSVANDRGVQHALDRDARDYDLIVYVLGSLVLLLGIVALTVLP